MYTYLLDYGVASSRIGNEFRQYIKDREPEIEVITREIRISDNEEHNQHVSTFFKHTLLPAVNV